MHRLKWFLVGGAILLLSLPLISQAEFKVGKVIKVGKADWEPFLGPLRWSPKGDRIAFWTGNELRLADTTGAVVYSKAFDKPPFRYEWVDDSSFCIRQMYWIESGRQYRSVVNFDIRTGTSQLLEEDGWIPGTSNQPSHVYIDGPFVSLEGNVYYTRSTLVPQVKSASPLYHKEIMSLTSNKSQIEVTDHLVTWDSSGLNLVNLDLTKTTRIGTPLRMSITGQTAISPDRNWVISGGILMHVADSSFIVLDTFKLPRPSGAKICGFGFPQFNPTHPEIGLNRSCDDGHKVLLERTVLFDYETKLFTSVDSILSLTNCNQLVYDITGNWFGILSDSGLHIVRRTDR